MESPPQKPDTKPLTEQAEKIFYEAQQLDTVRRSDFVLQACAGREELYREVTQLLAAAKGSEAYFDDLSERLSIDNLLARAKEPEPQWAEVGSGQQVGQYTLTELVGTGGMGAVWRAQRSDGLYDGEVAIKLLNLTANGVAMHRFELEAQTLAKLAHSNISRLLDAGIAENGRPFIVLEFVDGVSVDEFSDTKKLNINARVRLFLEILDAVCHAHAHLIVHRDIKPSNVLVTAEGMVKLLDFGVAKILKPEQAGNVLTQELGAALTPDFAAPEQLLGQTITTATDVYDLGILLYVLITGCHPRPFAEVTSFTELQDAILRDPPNLWTPFDDEPDKLSQVAQNRHTSSATLRRDLHSDLNNIVRKALAVRPDERYGTAMAFANDLRCYLKHEPVAAQADTFLYRAKKFVRRHELGVTAGLIATIFLLLATVISVSQSLEARRQRDAAIDQQHRVQASNEFLTYLLEEIGPRGEALTPIQLLDRSVELLEQHDQEQPFVGRLLYNLSQRYSAHGATERALELLGRAEEMTRRENDLDLLAAILCTFARDQYLSAPDATRLRVQEAKRVMTNLPSPSTDSYVSCVRAEAILLEMQENRSGAIKLLSDARENLQSSDARSSYLYNELLDDLSQQYLQIDRFDKTLDLNNERLNLSIETGREGTLGHLKILIDRAAMLHQMGEVFQAFQVRQQAVEGVRELEKVGEVPISFWHGYAGSLRRLGRYEKSLPIYLANADKARAQGNIFDEARTNMQMGRLLVNMDRTHEAKQRLGEAKAVYLDNPGFGGRHLQLIALAQAEIQLQEGDGEGSRTRLRTLIDETGYPNDKSAPGLKYVLFIAASVALATGHTDEAATLGEETLRLAIDNARDPTQSADVGTAYLLCAEARLALGKLDQARSDVDHAVVSLTNGFGPDHPDTLQAKRLQSRLRD